MPPSRYLFAFADPGAEAFIPDNDWALLREMLAEGGVLSREVQDEYIDRLRQPGAGRGRKANGSACTP